MIIRTNRMIMLSGRSFLDMSHTHSSAELFVTPLPFSIQQSCAHFINGTDHFSVVFGFLSWHIAHGQRRITIDELTATFVELPIDRAPAIESNGDTCVWGHSQQHRYLVKLHDFFVFDCYFASPCKVWQ